MMNGAYLGSLGGLCGSDLGMVGVQLDFTSDGRVGCLELSVGSGGLESDVAEDRLV